ncbi:MAG TPA: hypothetical protein VNN72_03535 [Polyangiaceae bacterium]|nr:hypothetical protein [Polyangiaceae bacterium]
MAVAMGGCGGESMRASGNDDAVSGGTSAMGGTSGTSGTGGTGSCGDVTCSTPDCSDGVRPILGADDCCPTCPAPELEACESSAECTLATSDLVCCDCAQAYSANHVAADRCMHAVGDPPKSDPACVRSCPRVACGTCAQAPSGAACIRGKCEPTYTGGT